MFSVRSLVGKNTDLTLIFLEGLGMVHPVYDLLRWGTLSPFKPGGMIFFSLVAFINDYLFTSMNM